MKDKELLDILVRKLEREIPNYDYYTQEGKILDLIEQILNIIKVMNGKTPFDEWYIEILKDSDKE